MEQIKSPSSVRRLKFRIYPDAESKAYIDNAFNNTRAIYNLLLDDYIFRLGLWQGDPETYEKPSCNLAGLNQRLTLIREVRPWLKTTLREALTQSAASLAQAFSKRIENRKKGIKTKKLSYFPRFKSRFDHQSFKVSGEMQMRSRTHQKGLIKLQYRNQIFTAIYFTLPGCSQSLDIRWHRSLPSYPTSYSISREPDGRYYISFTIVEAPKLTYGQEVIGLDLGIKDLLTYSTGEKVKNEKKYLELDARLKRLQRRHAKSKKGGQNREKLRLKIASLYRRIRNYSDHQLHEVSRDLVNRCQVIGLESLNIQGMVKNHHLARSILTANWGKFNRFLEYKARESMWCDVVWIDPFYPSSRLCHIDGYYHQELKLKDRNWICPRCLSRHDRDLNAAINIRNEALRLWGVMRVYGSPGKVIGNHGGRPMVYHTIH